MTVDRIEPLDKRRSKVFLDGSFAFVLYGGELRKYRIEVGADLPETLYREILDTVVCRRARERSLYLLKTSDKTESEIRRKLREGWYPGEAVEEAVQFLKRYCYLDDGAYARHYVEAYGGRKSRAELRGRMREKGISGEDIDAALRELDPDEDAQIRSILKKRRYSGRDDPGLQRKHMAYLVRRGFSYDAVRRVMEEWEEPR